jgi:gluconate 2-dehydrogenase gamma chain
MLDRREFMLILGSTVAALAGADSFAATPHVHRVAALGTMRKAYTYFTPGEAEFIEAAVARLIPSDETGPGALEADVPFFIDQQLAGEYGAGARFYNQGPFGATTPYQGYQWPLSPRQLYRVGIAATDRYCERVHGARFAQLEPARQDEVLRGLQGIAGDVDLKDVPGAVFFAQLLGDAKDGFFADPAYGGNRDMVGWKLVGFPGVAATYSNRIGRNEPYDVQPVDLGSMQQARVPTDHHGHPIHQRADVPRQTTPPAPSEGDEALTFEWKPGTGFAV